MKFSKAIMRLPGEDFGAGITTGELGQPDYALILKQHAAYVETFRSLGVEPLVLEALPGFPDAYFVEDAAVVFAEAAVIARPGALARRGEEDTIEQALARFKPTVRIQAPGTLDGGDVLMADRHFFIGLSERTNREGAEQLGRAVEQHGYTWTLVPAEAGTLHLKSSVSYLGEKLLLVSDGLAGCAEFQGYDQIVAAPGEKQAPNLLRVNDHLIMPANCPQTRRKLEALGLPVIEVEASEAHKMDGGLSCMSLRF
jgi:dimethylargininase